MTGGVTTTESRRSHRPVWVLAPLLPLMFVHEFNGPDGPASFLYDKVLGDLRLLDMVLVLYVVAALIVLPARRPARVRGLLLILSWLWVGVLFLAVVNGASRGSTNLFFDWRSIVVGAAVGVLTWRAVRDADDARIALRLFLVVSSVYSTVLMFGFFALDWGVVMPDTGGDIPVHDGGIQWILCGATLIALNSMFSREHVLGRTLSAVATVSCGLVVLFSFRRTYWVILVVGILVSVLLVRTASRRMRLLLIVGLGAASILLVAGPDRVILRLKSIDPYSEVQQYSATNTDHLHDVQDAWNEIQKEPILGRGVGVAYTNVLTRNWKGSESFAVHNALLHVWVFYGLLGAIVYILWHLVYFKTLYGLTRVRSVGRVDRASALAASFGRGLLGWSIGSFLVGCLFTPWPFSFLQVMIFLGMMWGISFTLLGVPRPASR